MYKRLDDMPVYEHRDSSVDANYYNHVTVALKRLGEEIRFPIPKLRHLDLILQQDAWIIVDRALNDVPVAAWTKFLTANRDNLHKAVKCDLNLYHANADLILNRTLEAMELLLGEELAEYLPDDKSSIVEFQAWRNPDAGNDH
jgi:hypothetical protein